MRVLARLGIQTMILTAATGGIAPGLNPGDLVTLSDHLNLLGTNPLRGPNNERFGPRFPDMTAVYDPELRETAIEVAGRFGWELKSGVYAALPGPSYETPAEIRMLRSLGADVVGMSTVPEAIVARHMGLRVLAFALVTNAAAGITGKPISHEEVLAAGREAGERLGRIIEGVIARVG
jgi:purine-nucleoside phosphorylase